MGNVHGFFVTGPGFHEKALLVRVPEEPSAAGLELGCWENVGRGVREIHGVVRMQQSSIQIIHNNFLALLVFLPKC